jgi:hypothetical protein
MMMAITTNTGAKINKAVEEARMSNIRFIGLLSVFKSLLLIGSISSRIWFSAFLVVQN